MEVFFELLIKILPLYSLILLGYISSRYLKLQRETIANLVIYTITPVVIFSGISNTEIGLGVLLLPILFFALCSFLCLLFYFLGKKIWNDGSENILAFAAGSGNCGYFGIPVSVLFFGEEALGIAAICVLGNNFFENTLGVFIAAKGRYSAHEAIQKIVRLPTLYAFIAGIIFSLYGFEFSNNVNEMMYKFTGAYTILGMMIIGLGLADVRRTSIDISFITYSFLARFLFWPCFSLFVLWLGSLFLFSFEENVRSIILLMSIVPVAANTVAWASVFNVHADKASVSVFTTTIFALFYIPLFVYLFL